MKVFIQIDADKLIREIMANNPEATASSCVHCIDWNYKTVWYQFHDYEASPNDDFSKQPVKPKIVKELELRRGVYSDAVVYNLRLPQLRKGLQLLLKDATAGEIPGIAENIFSRLGVEYPGNWDADAIDALVQYSIFGRLVYG